MSEEQPDGGLVCKFCGTKQAEAYIIESDKNPEKVVCCACCLGISVEAREACQK